MERYIAILGDTHLDHSPKFSQYFEKFYNNIFFPTLYDRGITDIIQVGDLFDSRKKIDISCIHHANRFFFEKFYKTKLNLITLVGNHDSYHKNTLSINSPTTLIGREYNISVFDYPAELPYGLIIPWICADNQDEIFSMMEKSSSKFLFGHLELSGFEMNKGYIMEHGHDPQLFSKFDKVITGHYHTHSQKGNIFYTGTPYQLTFNDAGDPKGFWIMDTKTGDMEFIQNPYNIFHKIEYNDGCDYDLNIIGESYVRLTVLNKTDTMAYDLFLESLSSKNLLELKIVETFDEFDDVKIDINSVNISDTLSLLTEYVEKSNVTENSGPVKSILTELYNDAVSFGEI